MTSNVVESGLLTDLVDEVVEDDQADLDMNEEVVEFASDDDSDFEDLP